MNYRWRRRDEVQRQTKPVDYEENSSFMKEFKSHLVLHSDSGTDGSSTISKCMGNLFYYDRSYLNFSTKNIKDFNLSRLLNPTSSEFLELEDPTIVGGWLQSMGGDDGKNEPGIQIQMLKDHSNLREFLIGKMKQIECGNSVESHLLRDKVIDHLKNISETIKKKKLMIKLKRLDDQLRVEKLKAKRVLNPEEEYNAQVAVETWFKSNESKELERECDRIYQNCMAGLKIGPRSFVKYANHVRFNLVLHDRNRMGVYSFTNKDFAERKPKFLPHESFFPEDGFKSLPSDWNPDCAPYDGAEPSCYVMELTGDNRGLKGGKTASVILSKSVIELCLRYREMKLVFLGERPVDAPFFENADKKGLSDLRFAPGSLLFKFAKVCNLSEASVNLFRRSSEFHVQQSPALKKSVEKLQSHSQTIAETNYYRKADDERSNYIVQLNKKEGANIGVVNDEQVLRKRKLIDQAEKVSAIDRAKRMLFDDKVKKSSGKGKVKPDERNTIQEYFAAILDSKEKFPGILVYEIYV